MTLTKPERDALPASDFAVPGKRALPIHDQVHVRMAWNMLHRTKGLTDAERAEGRKHILRKAKELGIDTSGWTKIAAMRFEAMALHIPDGDHPNKMPFSGVLTRVGEPSDGAPHGSNGRRIVLSQEAAEAALGSLLGMGVNLTSGLGGHDPQAKVGIITAATIEGNAIVIEGFIYKSDFPEAAETIKAQRNVLGFSFEADHIVVADISADPLVITACTFTGAAILMKDKAAYRTTSLAAASAPPPPLEDFIPMTREELEALFGNALIAAMKPIEDRLTKMEAAAKPGRIDANAALRDMVAPHVKRLEHAAAAMEAAGIGGHPAMGPSAYTRGVAKSMYADAVAGQLPTIHRDHDWPLHAGAEMGARVEASTLCALVEPHAVELENIAAAMESAGIGTHPAQGHAAHARHVAKSIRYSAATDRAPYVVPRIHREADWPYHAASAQPQRVAASGVAIDTAAVTEAVKAAVAPLTDKLAALETQVKDVKAGAFRASDAPGRKTLPPVITALLARSGIAAPAEGEGLSLVVLEKAIQAAGITDPLQRIALKRAAGH
jgi:hypothetical protein